MTKKRINTSEGDVVLIPVNDFQYCAVKVLFCSKLFRNVILIGVYPEILEDVEMPKKLPHDFSFLRYTGKQRITDGDWPKVGNIGLTEEEKQLSLRRVAMHVFLGDDAIRLASDEDWHTLPEMCVAGFVMLINEIKEIVLGSKGDLVE